ncbi:MAG: Wzz/FepE/Etk N-terminal domain-containing protein [Colwellia sp.]|nr:Wzz/FepE/Etk N-terminal domain-containing protein [Colwellia sp.]
MQTTEQKIGKELSLVNLITQLWQRKLFIIIVTAVFAIAGVVFALSLPNKYQAEVMVIPAEDSQAGGLSALASQFGGLAGMAGINLAGNSNKKHIIALQIIKSRVFLNDFVKRHQLEVAIFAGMDWDAASDRLLINPELYDEQQKTWVREYKFPKKLIPSVQEIYEVFAKMIEIKTDTREGTYRISVEYFSPELAQSWANWLVKDVNEHMRNVDIIQANKSIEYLQQQLLETQVSTTESIFFGLIEEQTKKAMLAKVQKDYVFSVIDPALAPEKKSGPKRALICILFVMLGGLLACAWVLLRNQLTLNKVNS